MYRYVLNSVVKISLMFAQYFEYYAIILRGVFSWTRCRRPLHEPGTVCEMHVVSAVLSDVYSTVRRRSFTPAETWKPFSTCIVVTWLTVNQVSSSTNATLCSLLWGCWQQNSKQYKFSTELAATLWWFTAAPKPLKIQVFWGHSAPGVAQPLLYSRGHN